MTDQTAIKLLRVAAALALLALGLMVWGIVDKGVIATVVSMTVGQAIGTLSFATFLFVIFRDIRRHGVLSRRRRRESAELEAHAAGGDDEAKT